MNRFKDEATESIMMILPLGMAGTVDAIRDVSRLQIETIICTNEVNLIGLLISINSLGIKFKLFCRFMSTPTAWCLIETITCANEI